MWVAPITTSIRLANVRDMCLGLLKLGLEGCKQCVLGFDRERLSARLEFHPDSLRSHGSFLDPASNHTSIGAPLKQERP